MDAQGGIFLSYRREETGHVAGRLADRLIDRFGERQVFMDVDSIPPGADFVESIQRAVQRCDVLLVLIGNQWTSMIEADGRRRLDDSEDFVVIEVREALDRGIPVVPVLVDGARMPLRQELPEPLRALVRRNAVRIDVESFRSDVAGLLDHLAVMVPSGVATQARRGAVEDGQASVLGNSPVSRRAAVRDTVGRPAIAVAGAGAEPGLARPSELPHSISDFVGRSGEIDRLNDLLRNDGRDIPGAVLITAIAGMAGVGKTALAVHWAHQVQGRFPDGQLYVNLRGYDPTGSAVEPGEAIRGFLDAFAVPAERIPVSLDAQAALYRSLLAGRRLLVVLDNARDAEQVRPLLPGSPSCFVVVTSRNQLTSLVATDGANPLVVDVLTAAEAHQLLARRLGQRRVDSEPGAVEDIITACAGLPLALAIVAARAATQPNFPLAVLAAELRKTRTSLDAFTSDDKATDVRTVLSWSYQQLTDAAARLFRLLGLHPGPDLATPAAASLAGIPIGRARQLLTELTRAHLVTESAPNRFTFHDLVRAHTVELVLGFEAEPDRRLALRRVLDHYLQTAHVAHRLLDPLADPLTPGAIDPQVTLVELKDHEEAMAWFTAEYSILLATVDEAATGGFDAHTWQLARALATFLDRRGHWRDSVAVHSAALIAVTGLGDRPGQAVAHRFLARAYAQLDHHDDAHVHIRRALDLFYELGDQTGQADTHYALARVLYRQGDHREALSHAERALALYEATGHRMGQAAALNAVGWFHALLGDHQRALIECRRALRLHQELDDLFGQAAAWDSIAYAHHRLGDNREAIVCYQRSIELFRELGDRYNEADTLARLGDAHHAIGDHNLARDAWRQAWVILDELKHPEADTVLAKLDD